MNPGDRQAGLRLLEQAVSCEFRILRSVVIPGPDGGEFAMRIELQFCFDPKEGFPEDDSPAIGLLFALALLSFEDARPRGYSEREYHEDEEFSLGAFLERLRYTIGGALRFDADYVSGRRMKTRLTAHRDGRVVIETQGRGKAPERWLARLQGGKPLAVVGS